MTPQIICPHCQAEGPWITDDSLEGVFTEICTTCLKEFSYRIRKGNFEPYPPKVNQNWKGKGEAGGKNDA